MVPLCFDREETFLLQFSIKFRKTNKKSKRLRLFCTATTNFPAVLSAEIVLDLETFVKLA